MLLDPADGVQLFKIWFDGLAGKQQTDLGIIRDKPDSERNQKDGAHNKSSSKDTLHPSFGRSAKLV